MKTKIKFLIPFIIFATVFLALSGQAATILKSIKVELNTLTVKAGSTVLPKDNIIYNGNVYIRADKAAAALDKTFTWDKSKKTVILKDKPTPAPTPKPVPKYSYSNPAPINVIQTITVDDFSQKYTAEVEVKEIIRGEEAWKMLSEANMFNSEAQDGYEYLLAKIYFKITDINEGEYFDLNGAIHFKAISMDGKEYDISIVVNPEPALTSKLYKGASVEGWQAYLVKSDDIAPKLAFGRDYNGKGGIWFKAYK